MHTKSWQVIEAHPSDGVYDPIIFSVPKPIGVVFNSFPFAIALFSARDPKERKESLLTTGFFLVTLREFGGSSEIQVEEHQSGRSPCPPDLFVKTNKQGRMPIAALPSSGWWTLCNTATQNTASPTGPASLKVYGHQQHKSQLSCDGY